MSLVSLTTEDVSDIFHSVYQLYAKTQLFEASGASGSSSRPLKKRKTVTALEQIQRAVVLNRNSSKIKMYTIQADVFQKFESDDLLQDPDFRKNLLKYNKDLYNLLQLKDSVTELNCDPSLLVPKSGDLPSERYLDCICREFEKVIFLNDLGARQDFQESAKRSECIEKITTAGKNFVKYLLLVLVNYKNVMQINNISNEYNFITNARDKNQNDIFKEMKTTEFAFLGLNKKTLQLHKLMKDDDYLKKFRSEMLKTEQYSYRGKTWFIDKKYTKAGIEEPFILNNIIGPVSLYDLNNDDDTIEYKKIKHAVTDKLFPVDNFKTIKFVDSEIRISDFISKCQLYAKNYDNSKENKLIKDALNDIQPFGMFNLYDVDTNLNELKWFRKFGNNKASLSMDRLLAYIYNYIEVSQNIYTDDTDSDTVKTKFVDVVTMYKSKQRTDIFENLNLYFSKHDLYKNKMFDIPLWYLFGPYNKEIAEDTFKLYYDIDFSLSSNFGVQYYNNNKELCYGTFEVFGKNPVVIESELENLLLEFKNLWLFLAKYANEDSTIRQQLGEEFGIYFYSKPSNYTENNKWNEDLNNKYMTTTSEFVEMYLQNENRTLNVFKNLMDPSIPTDYVAETTKLSEEDSNIIVEDPVSQNWKNLQNLKTFEIFKDNEELENFLSRQENNMLKKMFELEISNWDLFFRSFPTCKEYIENLHKETTKILNKYDDQKNFAKNLWDFLYSNIIIDAPSAKGVMSYKDYKTLKDSVLTINTIIDKYYQEVDDRGRQRILIQKKDQIVEAYKNHDRVRKRIQNKKFFTLRNVRKFNSDENWELRQCLDSIFKRDLDNLNIKQLQIRDKDARDYLSAVVPFEFISKDNETKKNHLLNFDNYFSKFWIKTNDGLSLTNQQKKNIDSRIQQKLSFLEPSLNTGYQSQSRDKLEIWNFCKITDIKQINTITLEGRNTSYSAPLYANIPKTNNGIVASLAKADPDDRNKQINEFEDEDENIYFHINKINPKNIASDDAGAYLDKDITFHDHINDLRNQFPEEFDGFPLQLRRREVENTETDLEDTSQYASYMSETFDRFFNEDKYNIVDKAFDPKNNKKMRSRMVFCKTGNRNNKEITNYIDDLVKQINRQGKTFIETNGTDANNAKQKLKILTRKLNIMLDLFNNNEATGFRVCHLLSYISSTCFMNDISNSGLSSDSSVSNINWDLETKINANAVLKVFFDNDDSNDQKNRNLENFIETSFYNWQQAMLDSTINIEISKTDIMDTFNKNGAFNNTYGLLPIEPISMSPMDTLLLQDGNQASPESYDLSSNMLKFKQLYKFKFENITNNYILGLDNSVKKITDFRENPDKTLLFFLNESKKQLWKCAYYQIEQIFLKTIDNRTESKEEIFMRNITTSGAPDELGIIKVEKKYILKRHFEKPYFDERIIEIRDRANYDDYIKNINEGTKEAPTYTIYDKDDLVIYPKIDTKLEPDVRTEKKEKEVIVKQIEDNVNNVSDSESETNLSDSESETGPEIEVGDYVLYDEYNPDLDDQYDPDYKQPSNTIVGNQMDEDDDWGDEYIEKSDKEFYDKFDYETGFDKEVVFLARVIETTNDNLTIEMLATKTTIVVDFDKVQKLYRGFIFIKKEDAADTEDFDETDLILPVGDPNSSIYWERIDPKDEEFIFKYLNKKKKKKRKLNLQEGLSEFDANAAKKRKIHGNITNNKDLDSIDKTMFRKDILMFWKSRKQLFNHTIDEMYKKYNRFLADNKDALNTELYTNYVETFVGSLDDTINVLHENLKGKKSYNTIDNWFTSRFNVFGDLSDTNSKPFYDSELFFGKLLKNEVDATNKTYYPYSIWYNCLRLQKKDFGLLNWNYLVDKSGSYAQDGITQDGIIQEESTAGNGSLDPKLGYLGIINTYTPRYNNDVIEEEIFEIIFEQDSKVATNWNYKQNISVPITQKWTLEYDNNGNIESSSNENPVVEDVNLLIQLNYLYELETKFKEIGESKQGTELDRRKLQNYFLKTNLLKNAMKALQYKGQYIKDNKEKDNVVALATKKKKRSYFK